MGGKGGWEQRSEACVKIQKKNWGGGVGSGGGLVGGGGVRVDVNGEVKLLGKFKKKKKKLIFFWGGGGRVRRVGGVGLGGGGVRVDGNRELKLL